MGRRSPVAALPSLIYDVLGTVRTTVVPSKPLDSSLLFSFANASSQTASFANPQNLPPDPSVLPPLDDETSNPLDRFYVYFYYGSEPGDLCTPAEAAGIQLKPEEGSGDWEAVAMEGGVGRYWILFPRSTSSVPARQSRGFRFTDIVVASGLDLPPTDTMLVVEPRLAGGVSSPVTVTFYKEAPLRILELTASSQSVPPGSEVTLSWTASGADHCSLRPGGYDNLGTQAEQVVPIDDDTRFTLTAVAESGHKVEKTIEIRLAPGWAPSAPNPWQTANVRPLVAPLGDSLVMLDHAGQAWRTVDGVNWTAIPGPAAPPYLDCFGATAATFEDDLWVIGGYALGKSPFAVGAMRSPDAVAWTTVNTGETAPFPRTYPGVAAFAGRLWILGGNRVFDLPADVWASQDGADWEEVASAPPWTGRMYPAVLAIGGRLWLCGGFDLIMASFLTDTWSSADGANWVPGPPVPWTDPRLPVGAAVGGAGYLLACGRDGSVELWRLDPTGAGSWSAVPGAVPVTAPFWPGNDFELQLGAGTLPRRLVAVGEETWTYVTPLPPAGT